MMEQKLNLQNNTTMKHMENKQTAVDQLRIDIINWTNGMHYLPPDIFEKAKQKEREQIVDAFHDGMNSFPFDISRGRSELYYIDKYVKSTEE